ncbi:hypothetical protein GMAR_ORF100 [Golden Marseillevirus]|uniref:hypothetical protein n=1 Tax=Golden Marseillevirus TaxID=1720526 RepID=UPI000877ADC5|nr:hypothetical protein GMAR_ORF100 [Golden Marseillevirus]ALX27474.1 hypothetical protein GMAR_ORF100 [Golden Marseillevirus]
MTSRDPPRKDIYYRGMIPKSWDSRAKCNLWYKPLIFVSPCGCDIRNEKGERVKVNLGFFSSFACRPPLYNFLQNEDGTWRAYCRASRFSPNACPEGNFSPCCGIRPNMEGGCFECKLMTMI